MRKDGRVRGAVAQGASGFSSVEDAADAACEA
jgi:hypothetical protein